MSLLLKAPLILLTSLLVPSVHTLRSPLYVPSSPAQTVRSTTASGGVEVTLPSFVALFDGIAACSPMAASLCGSSAPQIEEGRWKTLDRHRSTREAFVAKLEKHNGSQTPALRFRDRIQGPYSAERFAALVMDLEHRSKWDPTVDTVEEIYPFDLVAANDVSGARYGRITRLGLGHCSTKPAAGGLVKPREQLTLCGINEFDTGAVIWGVECPESMDHLLPGDERKTRASSVLFSTAVKKVEGEEAFDVEYVLQLEIGGNVPVWSTTPITVQTVKQLFSYARKYFGPGGGAEEYLKVEGMMGEVLEGKEDLLITM